MREFLTLASILGLTGPIYKNPFVIAGAVLFIALIILVVALFLFRNSGKKKTAATNPPDWQRQQGGQPGQQGWGQPQGGWDANAAQQQPGAGWGMPAQQQPQQPAWGMPAQPQGGWDANAAQQQPGAGWGMPAQQQPQQPAWGMPAAQQQPGGWDAAAQQQQPAAWQPQQSPPPQPPGWGGMPGQQPQQPAGWGTPAPQQQPQQSAWGGQSGAGGGAPSWDQNALPASQDAWGKQSSAPAWGAQGNQQQAPAQPWGQPAQAADPWGQAAPAPPQVQPGMQAGWPANIAQPSTTPPGGNQPVPSSSWPPSPGYGQSPFDNPDADRTMLRPSGTGSSPSQTGLGYVRIEEGKEPGRIYEVRKESLSIGRSRESDIFLEDLAVSRLHASIVSMGPGNYALRDEGSANGTKVNGQTVNKYQPYPLQEGDKIQLGQTVLVFARR